MFPDWRWRGRIPLAYGFEVARFVFFVLVLNEMVLVLVLVLDALSSSTSTFGLLSLAHL